MTRTASPSRRLVLFALPLLLVGCGKRGTLRMPDDPTPAPATPVLPPPTAPAATMVPDRSEDPVR